MASIEELKNLIDLHDLADKLGLERPHGRGNYKSPHHDDKSPSLSIYDNGRRWKDHSQDNAGGSCVDLVVYALDLEVGEAIRKLHEWYGLAMDRPEPGAPRRQRSKAEFIAEKCLVDPAPARAYLEGRGIVPDVIDRGIKRATVGFNAWHSEKRTEGEFGYGGPAAAFIVRSQNPGHVVAVDMRYLEPELNGGVKTQTQGDKAGAPWSLDPRRIEAAHTVYIVESPVNALSVESCALPAGTTALATRGTQTIESIDWTYLRGKAVRICMDYDSPDKRGRCAGQDAAWKLYHVLAWHGISAMLVDQYLWPEEGEGQWNDINDVLQALGPDDTRKKLKQLDEALIPGMHWNLKMQTGSPRVFLPSHDLGVYGTYRVSEDFTRRLQVKKDDQGETRNDWNDVCGFRIVDISRVRIASAKSVMTGEQDYQPTTLFAVSVQEASHGKTLQRRVFTPERLYNVEHWKKLGFVYNQGHFTRMVNILSRTVELGSQDAINFVGLAWRDGRPKVNEGPDCYFVEEKQCPYHNLIFPRGTPAQGARVLEAYQRTFADNAAALPLVWGLGGHLKAFLGFWPHFVMEAQKGAGKSTLIKRLESTLAFTMFSRTQMETAFRTVTSTSHTFHPVGWEEISAGKQEIIDKAVSALQETYQYAIERRGSDSIEFVKCAPVMLAGEDVPVKSLTGKLIRTQLTVAKQGPMVDDALPAFPVRQWLDYLAGFTKAQIKERYRKAHEYCIANSSATGQDGGARRMVENYSAVLCAWSLLCDFLDVDKHQGGFDDDLVKEMNQHINETSTDREPWVWILETLLSEISSNMFAHPHVFIAHGNTPCLAIRPSHIMDHMAHAHRLRAKWDSLPIKTARRVKEQMHTAGVLVTDTGGKPLEIEKTINSRREGHLLLLDLNKLEQYGLYASIPESIEEQRPVF